MMKAGYPWNSTVAEILGAKRFLAEQCGIPAHAIRGFRSPYLMTNPLVRQASGWRGQAAGGQPAGGRRGGQGA